MLSFLKVYLCFCCSIAPVLGRIAPSAAVHALLWVCASSLGLSPSRAHMWSGLLSWKNKKPLISFGYRRRQRHCYQISLFFSMGFRHWKWKYGRCMYKANLFKKAPHPDILIYGLLHSAVFLGSSLPWVLVVLFLPKLLWFQQRNGQCLSVYRESVVFGWS